MKIKKYRNIVFVLLILLVVIAGCKEKEKKKPAAPEPLKPEDFAKKIPEQELSQQVAEAEASCQKQGGINCKGCCKNPIFSSNVLTCCSPINDSCVERFQLQAVFEGLGEVTIERFPNGNYGVWYGEKDETFGNRQFVNAENIGGNTYKFIVDGNEYHFTVTEAGCSISIGEPPKEKSEDRTYYFVFVPIDNSWSYQKTFEESAENEAVFFQDI